MVFKCEPPLPNQSEVNKVPALDQPATQDVLTRMQTMTAADLSSFCPNHLEIAKQINSTLPTMFRILLSESENEGVNPALVNTTEENPSFFVIQNNQIIFNPTVTRKNLIQAFLNSWIILQPWPVHHMIFDYTHFGVALNSATIMKIVVEGKTLTFADFVMQVFDTIFANSANQGNQFVIEQLRFSVGLIARWQSQQINYSTSHSIVKS